MTTTFAPLAPTIRAEPTQIAADTFVIHSVQPALGAPLYVHLNSLVIRGAEPVIVDTGTIANRTQWMDDAFSLVEPEDVVVAHGPGRQLPPATAGRIEMVAPSASFVSSLSR